MRLYIAGPMTGYPRWNFDAFAAAARTLRAAGFVVHSPHEIILADGFDPDAPADDFTRDDYKAALMQDLRVVAHEVEGVALLPGWRASRGAVVEVALARALGKPALPFETWAKAGRLGAVSVAVDAEARGTGHWH